MKSGYQMNFQFLNTDCVLSLKDPFDWKCLWYFYIVVLFHRQNLRIIRIDVTQCEHSEKTMAKIKTKKIKVPAMIILRKVPRWNNKKSQINTATTNAKERTIRQDQMNHIRRWGIHITTWQGFGHSPSAIVDSISCNGEVDLYES